MKVTGKAFRVFEAGGMTHTEKLADRCGVMKIPVISFFSHCVIHAI